MRTLQSESQGLSQRELSDYDKQHINKPHVIVDYGKRRLRHPIRPDSSWRDGRPATELVGMEMGWKYGYLHGTWKFVEVVDDTPGFPHLRAERISPNSPDGTPPRKGAGEDAVP